MTDLILKNWTEEELLPGLQWVHRKFHDYPPRLQQQWRVSVYENGVCTDTRVEWRDVPIVEARDD